MRSIRDIYKAGRGPSSSHTMGPARAAALFREETPEADAYRAVLYGSLSKTGKGHGTDRILTETFAPLPAEVVFSQETVEQHPNTLDLTALRGGRELCTQRVYSVGGGDLEWEGRPAPGQEQETYFENSFAEIKEFCEFRYISLTDYVELNEGAGIWDDLLEIWSVMQRSIQEGLAASGELPGGLRIERKAKSIHDHILVNKHPEIIECQRVCSYAYAVSEQNAGNGLVVTAPTCGSCGVLPAVLYYFQDKRGLSDLDVAHALGVAGLFGALAKRNASVSGAECGCPAWPAPWPPPPWARSSATPSSASSTPPRWPWSTTWALPATPSAAWSRFPASSATPWRPCGPSTPRTWPTSWRRPGASAMTWCSRPCTKPAST